MSSPSSLHLSIEPTTEASARPGGGGAQSASRPATSALGTQPTVETHFESESEEDALSPQFNGMLFALLTSTGLVV